MVVHVYNDYRTWTCENSGSALSECTYSDRTDYISSCTNDQICVYGECLNKSFYIQGTFTDGDEEKDLKYNVAGNKTFHISLPKHSEIRNATIKVEGGR